MTHDEIVAKIREALPEAEWHEEDDGQTVIVGDAYAYIAVEAGRVRVVLHDRVTEWFVMERDVPLDDAITIARLWATLGEPR